MPALESHERPGVKAAPRQLPVRPKVRETAAKPARPAGRVTHVVLTWRGGRTRFQISTRTWAEMEGAGNRIRDVLGRLTSGTWGAGDVVNTITAGLDGVDAPKSTEDELKGLLALMRRGGGGLGRNSQTERLVRDHVHARPLGESVAVAQAILVAALYGLPPKVADAAMTPEKLIGAALGLNPSELGDAANG